MDANLKAKWLADLRSGKFEQANGVLRDNLRENTYCCLGVLCIAANATFQDWKDPDYFEREIEDVPVLDGENLADGDNQELSPHWMETIGLPKDEHAVLIRMNDDGVPFSEIANYIEKNL